MTEFCCGNMRDHVLIEYDSEKFVDFDVTKRYFGIFRKNSPWSISISNCPFCGAKLPENLIDERWDTIMNELGSDYLPDDEGNPPKKELPEEFKTDEWWKKRGL